MKKSKLYFTVLFLTILSSCRDDKKISQSEVEIVTVQNKSSNKEDLIKLVEPFECNAIKDKIFVCYPLSLLRLDKENSKSNLDYETNKGVNYEKIAAVKRDFQKYFDKTASPKK